MKKIISCVLISSILSGCSYILPHRHDVEQGNIINAENVSRLHTGMSEEQVVEIMGHPVLTTIFTPNRIDYVYTIQFGHGKMHENRLTCIFYGGRLREIIQS